MSNVRKNVEQRPNKRPEISDLDKTGNLEKDADLIVFIYRDEFYNDETLDKGIAEIIVAKHRYGITGNIKLNFCGEYSKFESQVNSKDEF